MKVHIYQTNTKNKFPFNLFAIGIKFFSKTNYSHYAISYVSENGKRVFCDSSARGVRQMTEEKFNKHNTISKAFICRVIIPRAYFLTWFEQHQGKSYGFAQVLGLLLKIFKIIKHNPLGSGSKRIICNELVILFLNRFYQANIEDTDSLDLNGTEKLITKVNI